MKSRASLQEVTQQNAIHAKVRRHLKAIRQHPSRETYEIELKWYGLQFFNYFQNFYQKSAESELPKK